MEMTMITLNRVSNALSRSLLALLCIAPLGYAAGCSASGNSTDSTFQFEDVSQATAYVVGNQLVVLNESGKAKTLELPVQATKVFGVVGNRVLFGAEPRPVMPHTDETGGDRLWTVDLDGSNAQRLVDNAYIMRVVHSDALGGMVFWTRDMNVYLLDSNTREPRLVASRASMPAISPDGTRVAYSKLPNTWEEGSLPGGFDLHVINLVSGEDKALTHGFDDADAIWTPDGRQILFLSGARNGLTSIWRVDAEGGSPERVTNVGKDMVDDSFIPNPSANTDVSWSKDGLTLLFSALYSDEGEVITLEFDPAYQFKGMRSLGHGLDARWTPEGDVIVRQNEDRVRFVRLDTQGEILATIAEMDLPAVVENVLPTEHVEHEADLAVPMFPGATLNDSGGFGPANSGAAPHRFRLPLASNPGYSAYYDDNCTGGVIKDWKCGSTTYDGHKGTDFLAGSGTTVYAGDGGTVSARNDGCATTGSWGCGGGFGNYVKINHGSSWYSIYAHFTKGTPIGFVNVSCGQSIGKSGSSGNSTGYHLHFEVQRYGGCWDDPFAGQCSGAESFWTNQNGGWPTLTCH